jgi:hypothetical protein
VSWRVFDTKRVRPEGHWLLCLVVYPVGQLDDRLVRVKLFFFADAMDD